MLTIDANVFVSGVSTTEPQHSISASFLKHVLQLSLVIYCPAIVLPETAAGIARPTNNIALANRAVNELYQLSGINFIPHNKKRALQAADIAILHRLRGADANYVQVAHEFSTTLITWDKEMLERGINAVPTMTPTDWLAANSTV